MKEYLWKKHQRKYRKMKSKSQIKEDEYEEIDIENETTEYNSTDKKVVLKTEKNLVNPLSKEYDFPKNKADPSKIPVIKLCRVLWCNQCRIKFKTALSLKDHLETHPASQKTMCFRLCNSSNVLVFKCELPFCKNRFSNKSDLTSHMLKHKNENKFKCKICAKSFATPHCFNLHLQSHSDGKFFKCRICGEKFSNKSEFAAHRIIHEENNPYVCPICSKNFLSQSSLQEHVKMHSDVKSFECEICEKKFHTRKQVREHVRCHTRERRFQCGLCKKKFFTRNLVAIHIKTDHNNSGSYECQVCFAKFVNNWDFESHVKTHPEYKAFTCDNCKQSSNVNTFPSQMFTQIEPESHLLPNDHTYVASGAIYKCPLCSNKFTKYNYFNIHIPYHFGYKLRECDICKELFPFKSQVKPHMKNHKSEKLFACDICFEEFPTIYDLKIHQINHLSLRVKNENVKKNSRSSKDNELHADNCGIHHSIKEREERENFVKTKPELLFLENQEYSESLDLDSEMKLENIKLEFE